MRSDGRRKEYKVDMKYIRTTNGVYENILSDLFGEYKYFHGEEILKFADTIEELIDGWVIECPEWDKPTFKSGLQYMNWEDYIKTANKHKAIHYGVIFVRLPNGAIRIDPVAKMNKKGELELI